MKYGSRSPQSLPLFLHAVAKNPRDSSCVMMCREICCDHKDRCGGQGSRPCPTPHVKTKDTRTCPRRRNLSSRYQRSTLNIVDGNSGVGRRHNEFLAYCVYGKWKGERKRWHCERRGRLHKLPLFSLTCASRIRRRQSNRTPYRRNLYQVGAKVGNATIAARGSDGRRGEGTHEEAEARVAKTTPHRRGGSGG